MLISLILIESIPSVRDCNRVFLSRVKMQDGMCSIAGMLLRAYIHNYNLNNMSIHIPKVKVKQSTCYTGRHNCRAFP